MAVVSGVMDFTNFDTTPGANSLFSPLAGAQGTGDAYLRGMRKAIQRDHHLRMLVGMAALAAKRSGLPAFTGPYADQARAVLEDVMNEQKRAAEKLAEQKEKKNTATYTA